MSEKIEARNFKGTRDYLPSEMILRNKMLETIRSCFQRYGFAPLETPAIEYLDILMGKYGEEGDKLIYRLDYKGGSVAGMKYDLTIPLSRVVSQYNDLVLPFKRFQIQPVWRADRPQPRQGRFREFYQCDADIVGVDSVVADAEILTMVNEILTQLDIGKFVIRVNHRKILSGITEFVGLSADKEVDLCRAIDKLDKIGLDGVKKELGENGFTDTIIDKIFEVLSVKGNPLELLTNLKELLKSSEKGMQGIEEMSNILEYLKIFEVPDENIKLDLNLARGLDYYTGAIYESSSLELPHIGSLTGGGRYDKLIGSIGGKDVPAVGSTIGLDRIATVINQLGKTDGRDSLTEVLVTVFNEDMLKESLNITSVLRQSNIKAEVVYEFTKLKKQFSYADKKKIPFAVVIGPDEAEQKKATVKNLSEGSQEQVDQDQLAEYLLDKLVS